MQRWIVAGLTGLWGMAVMAAILKTTRDADFWRFELAALGGAALAGAVLAPLFARGRPEVSAVAAVLATVLGAGIAGAGFAIAQGMHNGLQGVALGPALVLSSIVQDLWVFAVWLLGGVALHLTASRLAAIP